MDDCTLFVLKFAKVGQVIASSALTAFGRAGYARLQPFATAEEAGLAPMEADDRVRSLAGGLRVRLGTYRYSLSEIDAAKDNLEAEFSFEDISWAPPEPHLP